MQRHDKKGVIQILVQFVGQREDGEDVGMLKRCLIRATGATLQQAVAGWRRRSSGAYQVNAHGKHLPARSDGEWRSV